MRGESSPPRRAASGTLDTGPRRRRGVDTSPARMVLVVAWCQDEPWRVGELLGDPGVPVGRTWGFGRQEPDGGGGDRVGSVRQRPGSNEPGQPWTSARISREQLSVTTLEDQLTLQNLGRRELLHGGVPVDRLVMRAGEVVELRNQLVLVVVRRPPILPALTGVPLHPFGAPDSDGMIGESPAAWELRRLVSFVGRRAGHALVVGPSGSGKELVAAALHRRHARGPWVSRNAATLPEGLVDAELFGNVRNYPNPGMADRPGLVGAADGGTLFLDEFGELPLTAQAHLLRVLDHGEYQRLGDARVTRARFRLLAATNRDPAALKEDVRARFPFVVPVPGLDTRMEDVPLLLVALFRGIATAEPDIAARFFPDADPSRAPRVAAGLVVQLLSRRYTTHVRELLALLWRALAQSTGDTLEALADEPRTVASGAGPPHADGAAGAPDIDAWVGRPPATIPAEVIQACIDACNGRIEVAWRRLGLDSRYVLSRLIRKHALVVRRTGGDSSPGEGPRGD